jgi:hypothetical protein
MNHLTILSSAQVDRLRGHIDKNVDVYKADAAYPLPEVGTLLQTPIEVGETPELTVDPDRHTADDADNAIRIYHWLSGLNRTQAADPRLWTTLALREFWNYMQRRWVVENASTVKSRYFVTGGRKALNRQGIARLWWGAALTHAPWERNQKLAIFRSDDPARFTRVFFSQQQYAVDLMERNLGGSLLIRTCVLEALEHVGPKVRQRDDLSQAVGRNLNQLLQTQQLEAQPPEKVRETILQLVERVAERLLAVGRLP